LTAAALTTTRPRASAGDLFPWIAFAPLLLLPLVAGSAHRVDLVLLSIEGILLYLGTRSPVWLLGALMVPELTIPNYTYHFGSVALSNRLFLSVAIFAIIQPHLSKGDWFTGRAGKLLLVALAFFVLAGAANTIAVNVTYAFKFARYLSTGILALLLVPAALRTETDVRNIAIVCLIIGFACAGVAFLQHFGSSLPFPLIQSVPHSETPTEFSDWGGRALGLTESPIYLPNAMLLLALPLAGVLLIGHHERDLRIALLVVLFFLLMAAYYSYTRSWTYALAAGIIPFLILYRGRYLKHMWFGMLLAVVIFFMWTGYQGNRYTLGANEDSSASGRFVLWDIGLKVALDNPVLGVGHGVFTTISPDYADEVDPALLERQNAAEVIGVYEPHNDFLNVWLSFGSFALLLYIATFYITGKNFLVAFDASTSPLIKGVAMGSAGALLAFAVSSSFHNLFDSTLTLWLLAGLSVALANIATKQQRAPAEAPANSAGATATVEPEVSVASTASAPASDMRAVEAVAEAPAWPVPRLPGRRAIIATARSATAALQSREASQELGRGMAGAVLFVVSEMMLFGGLFAAYFFLRNQAGGWPPTGVEHTVSKGLGIALSVFLISSSLTAHYALLSLKQGKTQVFKLALMLTMVLGGIFIGGQIYEWLTLMDEGLKASSGAYGSTFFVITGFHGAHVIAGLAMLGVVLWRAFLRDFTATRHLFADAAVMYWHFVDVIWVFVLAALYLSY
jgi:heme/copper-type cytochrome/quinol oxidase subunit 3/O-antigen ligase